MCFCTESLIPLGEMEIFRNLVKKVWGEIDNKELNALEMLTVNKYVSLTRVRPTLEIHDPSHKDQARLSEQRYFANNSGSRSNLEYLTAVGARNLTNSICKVVANVYLDFWDELIYFNTYESYKGSFQCIECGELIPRSFDAHGQKYCTSQCKKRAAKRRYQKKKSLKGRTI